MKELLKSIIKLRNECNAKTKDKDNLKATYYFGKTVAYDDCIIKLKTYVIENLSGQREIMESIK